MNPHNTSRLAAPMDLDLVRVGKGTYGPIRVISAGRQSRLEIGSYCSIAQDVVFVLNDEHPMRTLTTFPFRSRLLGHRVQEGVTKGGICVEDDVWIGFRATVLDGVHIGQAAVIGAGALVTRDVPPYSVVGGCPAREIRKRFDEATIDILTQLKISLIDRELAIAHLDDLTSDLSTDSSQRLSELLSARK